MPAPAAEPAPEPVVGRRNEIDTIIVTLTSIANGGTGRIIELVGEAGIGKSTVIAAVVAAARGIGVTTWTAAPTLAESDLPWTGLALLLADVDSHSLDRLPSSQRNALLAATSTARSGDVEPEMVAFALTSLLDAGSDGDRAMVVVIDDAQWLDRASASAMAYALRRTPRRRCLVALASRVGEPMPFEPGRLVDAAHHQVIEVGGLSLAGLRQLLIDSHRIDLRRPDLARLHQRTGGNPLHAMELARLLAGGESMDSAALPPSLRATIGARIRGLAADTLRVMQTAALLAHPEVDVIQRALPDLDVLAALGPAEAEDIAAVRPSGTARRDTVAFRHPLLAAAAIDSMSTHARRTLHAALAGVIDDVVERALHVGLSCNGPNESAASELEQAGAAALARGSADAAVEQLRSSVALTPLDDHHLPHRQRRLFALADTQSTASDYRDAEATLDALEATQPDAALSVRIRLLRVVINASRYGPEAGLKAADAALAVTTDPDHRALLLIRMTRLEQLQNLDRGRAAAERALAAAPDDLRPSFELMLEGARALTGEPTEPDRLIDAAASWSGPWTASNVHKQVVELLVWTDHPAAIERGEEALATSISRGDRHYESDVLAQLGAAYFVRGDWARSEEVFRRSIELHSEGGASDEYLSLSLIEASRGNRAEAERLLELANQEIVRSNEGPLRWVFLRVARGQNALASGTSNAADELATAETEALAVGLRGIRAVPFRRDVVEGLVAAGRFDEAEAAADRLATDATRSALPGALADADAAAGVVAAARGNDDSAEARFAAAIAGHESCGLFYELARTLLAAGTAARRAGRRTDARSHLERAQGLFDGMGATVWSRRCVDEIDRLGTRRAGQSDSSLTPTEQQIADLVAGGRTNSEIASTLFVSVRTVESNLTRVYRKLGLRSRTELTRHLAS